MWILFKILAAVIAFIFRYKFSASHFTQGLRLGGVHYFEKIRTTKGGAVYSHQLGVEASTFFFRISRETTFDRFFKYLGISIEVQTGDLKFDQDLYISCDHMVFKKTLKENKDLRMNIQNLIEMGARSIQGVGNHVIVQSKGLMHQPNVLPVLSKLAKQISEISLATPKWYSDQFALRALMIESFIWSIAAFAVVGLLELFEGPQHVSQYQLTIYGVVLGLIMAALLIWMIVVFLRQSSRSHRILTESAVLLIFALPVLGIEIVSDVNTRFDFSKSQVTHLRVIRHWVVTGNSRSKFLLSRRNRKAPSYHVEFKREAEGVTRSEIVEVSPRVFQTIIDGALIPIEIGEGRLGLRWVRSINGVH